jgi:hypothetical protein
MRRRRSAWAGEKAVRQNLSRLEKVATVKTPARSERDADGILGPAHTITLIGGPDMLKDNPSEHETRRNLRKAADRIGMDLSEFD